MSKKLNRAAHGPGWAEVILGAFLSLILGVVIGALLLVFRPVVVVKELPKEDARDPKAIYFVEGSRDSGKAREATAKRKAFAGGQSVTVVEDELNTLAGPPATFASPPPPKAGEKAKAPTPEKSAPGAPASDDLLATGTPNFRIRDGALQIGVPVTVNLLGLSQKAVVQTRGGFVKRDEGFVYEPEVFYVGCLPVDRFPLLAKYARQKFLESQPIPDDVKAAWAKVANVAIEGNALKVTMP